MTETRRVAAVDIGTNTVRLLVADVAPPPAPAPRVTWLDRRTAVVRLGEGVDRNRALGVAAIDRTVAQLEGFGAAIAEWRCSSVRAVATSAVRDASNRDRFLDRAQIALGTRPEMITGEQESGLAFSGTTHGMSGATPYLVIDPGGGSIEFTLGDEQPRYGVSVDIGSVRLTERAFTHHPAAPGDLAAARRHVDELLAGAVELPVPPGTVLAVGGTFTSLAAIHLGLDRYDPERVHGTVLPVGALHDLTDRLAVLTIGQIERIPSLDPGRAPVILGGAVVAERAVAHIGAVSVTISEHDILDGIVLGLSPD